MNEATGPLGSGSDSMDGPRDHANPPLKSLLGKTNGQWTQSIRFDDE